MCPKTIRGAIEALAREPETRSIWLIGSRANSRATAESDWDVLAFREDEPTRLPSRCEGLDVLHVGPRGNAMLEGESITLSFGNFFWSLVDDKSAHYVGCDF